MDDLGRYTLLASGERFYPKHPECSTYTLRDIALGLARTCRFNGQFAKYEDSIYSVAQHSILVDDIVDKIIGCKPARPWAVLHDAPEGILGDIISPVKAYVGGFDVLEGNLAVDMVQGLRVVISDSIRDIVHFADLQACAMEAEALSGISHVEWGLPKPLVSLPDLYPDWKPWGVKEATERYEERFRALIDENA